MQKPKKILLVDDDKTSIYLTQWSLQKLSIEVDVQHAADGFEALEIIHQVCAKQECPELILLDLNMPFMDGFEFLDNLQESIQLSKADIKIIIMSANSHYLEKAKARQLPAIDYLEKPLNLEKIEPFLK